MGTLVYSPPWRWVLTDRHSQVLTFLDVIASKRQMLFTLNKPASATGQVPADNPEVNIVHDDGDPFLDEGNRLLFGFRRETGTPPYTCRYAGPVLQCNDVVQNDQPITSFSSFDPWQVMFSRPIRRASGALPGRTGFTYVNTRGNVIALNLLKNTISTDGACYLDLPPAYGGSAFYTGTIENTSHIDINFQQGATVGDAWTQLCDGGSLDIILEPVWDPINRPGICCQVSIYNVAGRRRNAAIFAWDQPSRSLIGIDRLDDGTQRENLVQPFLQGGIALAPITNTPSVSKYGTYWGGKIIPGGITTDEVVALAETQLLIKKNGSETIKINPAPDRSPVPFLDYYLGDAVPVYASKRFRKKVDAGTVNSMGHWSKLQRIYSIPIELSDQSTEIVKELMFSADGDIL